jgi:hypothetical protein
LEGGQKYIRGHAEFTSLPMQRCSSRAWRAKWLEADKSRPLHTMVTGRMCTHTQPGSYRHGQKHGHLNY